MLCEPGTVLESGFRQVTSRERDEADTNGGHGHLLAQLQETNARLAGLVTQLTRQARNAVNAPQPSSTTLSARNIKKHLLLRAGRRRNALGRFLEGPSWDMLLDLAAVGLEGKEVSVSSICISSGAAQSSALRKLAAMEAAGLVRRYLDEQDRRRVCLALTETGLSLVQSALLQEMRSFAEWTG